ncbi:radical SAM protein [Fundidesulfovibrio magnetotacticus]|uniref:radical SAM protein n=1 Tax=Fundidesulfovibrio magnetotacticus TaxID=2730080 RepID=UPI001564274D|nr:radical SAM protein [Fundidesulfovibrio magnetotacticus]
MHAVAPGGFRPGAPSGPAKGSPGHPCFDDAARSTSGRVHLPVAPACNIACGYCDRRSDCPNECRPGVASRLLSPREAEAALADALARDPRIRVAGVAGPGDPMAMPEAVVETFARIKARFPWLIGCLSTNGLGLPEHVDALARAGVSHVTVTVNAVRPEVGARIYDAVRWQGRELSGQEGAGFLLERQRRGIAACRARGLTVKVNTVLAPGVNDAHVEDVAREAARLGADRMNLIGLIPVPGTRLGDLPAPCPGVLAALRGRCARHLPQMRHCARCRADAAGLLDEAGCC